MKSDVICHASSIKGNFCCCCLFTKSCLTLCKDCSPPGSSVHGIFQARTLEWVTVSFSRGSSRPRDQTHLLHCILDSLPLSHQGSPLMAIRIHINVLESLVTELFKRGYSIIPVLEIYVKQTNQKKDSAAYINHSLKCYS